MAHSGDGTGWDENSPANAENVSDGAKEIRDLRKGARIRLEREHEDMGSSSAGGEHLAGSAKAYFDDTADVSTRPDSVALASTDDDGRLLVDDGAGANTEGQVFYWEDDQWNAIQIVAANLAADAVEVAAIKDGEITAAKLNTTQDWSGITITLPNDQAIPGQPTISDFTNSTHDHADAAGGGASLDPTAVITQAVAGGASRIKTGTYTGDGNNDRSISISSPAFDPKIVIVSRVTGDARLFVKTSGMATSSCIEIRTAAHYNADRIELSTNAFIVDSGVNTTDKTYFWAALG